MSLRTHCFILSATLACACGSEGAPGDPAIELPFVVAPSDGSVDGRDAGSDDHSALDGSSVPHSDGSLRSPGEDDDDDQLDEGSACAASAQAAETVLVEEQVEVQVPVQVEVKVPVQVEVQVQVQVQVQVPYEVHTPAPVALYVMFDRSLSMSSNGLWTSAVSALKEFVADPASSGMDMAIQYFPSGGSCNGSGYSTPEVALGRLPGHANAIINNLSGQSAGGIGTPIEGALRGATEYCKKFQAANAKEKCVAVLVTDGKPEWDSCEKDDDKLAAIADAAWKQFKVRTFAVGLKGADFTLLDKIAKAGGASDCDLTSTRFSCDVSVGADKLASALGRIRDTVTTIETRVETRTETQTQTRTELQTQIQTQIQTQLQTQVVTRTRPLQCEWRMPVPEEGVFVDSGHVNVSIRGGSDAALRLGRVPGLAACRDNAWYYDSPTSPTRLIACPQTCARIESGGYTDVKVLLGCQTNIYI
jgi:hypothetical protein